MDDERDDSVGAAPDRPIVLTGFMGTGKTTVGKLVAAELGFEFVDTDELIESRHGPIPEIFARRGEEGFRRLEREVAAELAGVRRTVVATGGKLMLDDENARVLGEGALVVALVASPDSIVARLLEADEVADRPLLAGDRPAERIRSLLAERAAGYARFERIGTDGLAPEAVADELLRRHRRAAAPSG